MLVEVERECRRHCTIQLCDERRQARVARLRPNGAGEHVRYDRDHDRQATHRPHVRANAEPPPPLHRFKFRVVYLNVLSTLSFIRNAALVPVVCSGAVRVDSTLLLHWDAPQRAHQRRKHHRAEKHEQSSSAALARRRVDARTSNKAPRALGCSSLDFDKIKFKLRVN